MTCKKKAKKAEIKSQEYRDRAFLNVLRFYTECADIERLFVVWSFIPIFLVIWNALIMGDPE